MTKQNSQTAMDQRIFNRSLSVETVSVYLMLTGLADLGESLTVERLESVWNGKPDDLWQGVEILSAQGILERSGNGNPSYRILPFEFWKNT